MKRKTMKLFLCIVIALLFCGQNNAFAQMYRCQENGRTFYTDRPCDGSASPTTNTEPRQDRIQKLKEHLSAQQDEQKAKEDKYNATKLEIKYLDLIDQQNALEKQLTKERNLLQKELDALRHKKEYANNNLAGAVWENSISKEMEAVTAQHTEKIEYTKEKLEKTKAERAATKEELQKYKEVYY